MSKVNKVKETVSRIPLSLSDHPMLQGGNLESKKSCNKKVVLHILDLSSIKQVIQCTNVLFIWIV